MSQLDLFSFIQQNKKFVSFWLFYFVYFVNAFIRTRTTLNKPVSKIHEIHKPENKLYGVQYTFLKHCTNKKSVGNIGHLLYINPFYHHTFDGGVYQNGVADSNFLCVK